MSTVLVPGVNVPTLLSQAPLTVIVLEPALTVPAERCGPNDPTVMLMFWVLKVAVPLLLFSEKFPPITRAFVARFHVLPPAVVLNTTAPRNSCAPTKLPGVV